MHTLFVITQHSQEGDYYWGPIGWTRDLLYAFHFMVPEAALACQNDEELIATITPVELD